MGIIKLRGVHNIELYINVKNIDGFFRSKERSKENGAYVTKIYTLGSGIPYLVYDSVQEILDKINEVVGLTINSDEERDKSND